MELYSQAASAATNPVATTNTRNDPFNRIRRTRGIRTAAVTTLFIS
jgi:hypothetical protein